MYVSALEFNSNSSVEGIDIATDQVVSSTKAGRAGHGITSLNGNVFVAN